MTTTISVSLSGPALSFLLYENAKCRFQQEGFLLGEIVHKETTTITDNDQRQLNISKTVKINSIMPCPHSHYFYNGAGKINGEKIIEFLGSQFKRVVAWYKYRGIVNTKFTLRDKIIHKQLIDFFSIPSETFSCCLLSNDVTSNAATHSYTQFFLRYNNGGFDKLPILIPNLSDSNTGYKNSEPASETFNKILRGLKIDKKTTQGLIAITKIQNALQKHIDVVVENLSESERYLFELEKEVKELLILKKLHERNNSDSKRTNDESSFIKCLECPATNYIPLNSIDTTPETSPELEKKNVSKTTSISGKGRKRGRS
ncbi:BRISC complex subunit FAM175B [Leptinotarsa decemlineata]|uniref:BRISC complex subunit FAM175B n=1 Tax=Leptinotarsa decemlineata TaxID=7539 RepID=UPI003D30AB42